LGGRAGTEPRAALFPHQEVVPVVPFPLPPVCGMGGRGRAEGTGEPIRAVNAGTRASVVPPCVGRPGS